MLAELLMAGAVGCANQSGAEFPGAYRDPANLVVGPLAWVGARGQADADGSLDGGYRWKQPVLVRPGHKVTIRVGAAAAGFARLTYTHGSGWAFGGGVRAVTFHACSRSR